jgi:hypothetical protein
VILDWQDKGNQVFVARASVTPQGWQKPATVQLRLDGRGSAGWRVDSAEIVGWVAVDGGAPLPSLDAAKAYASAWLEAAQEQKTLSPRIAR